MASTTVRSGLFADRALQRGDQGLTGGQVESRRGFVQHQQAWLAHHGARQQHPLSFPLAAGREPTPGELAASHRGELSLGPGTLGRVVVLEPRREHRACAGEHDIEHAEPSGEQVRQRMAGVADPALKFSEVAVPEGHAHHPGRSRRRLAPSADHAEEGRLASAVGPQQDPSFSRADAHRDRPEDPAALDPHGDVLERNDRVVGHRNTIRTLLDDRPRQR